MTYNCFIGRIPEPLKTELRRIKRANINRVLTWMDVVSLAKDSQREAKAKSPPLRIEQVVSPAEKEKKE